MIRSSENPQALFCFVGRRSVACYAGIRAIQGRVPLAAVRLLHSAETAEGTSRLKNLLSTELPVTSHLLLSDSGLEDRELHLLESDPNPERILLSTGCPLTAFPILVDRLGRNHRLQLADLSGRQGLIISVRDEACHAVTANDIPLDDVLRLQGLVWHPQARCLTHLATGETVADVQALSVDRGFLKAELHPAPGLQGKEAKQIILQRVRELSSERLRHRFGLEPRNITFTITKEFNPARRRALDAGFYLSDLTQPTADQRSTFAPSPIPSRLAKELIRPEGPLLLTVLAPNRETLLRTLLVHGPSRVIAVADSKLRLDPLAQMLATQAAWQTITVDRQTPNWPVSLCQQLNAHLQGNPFDYDMTAGDASLRNAINAWLLKHQPQVRSWALNGAAAHTIFEAGLSRSLRSAPTITDWVTCMSPHGLLSTPSPSSWTSADRLPDEAVPMGKNLLDLLCRRDARKLRLADLRKSKGAFGCSEQSIRWPGCQSPLSAQEVSTKTGMDGFGDELLQTPDQGVGAGRWWEWAVSLWLRMAGIQEVAIGVKTAHASAAGKPTPKTPRLKHPHRDDLDVVTCHNGTYTLWSCKTGISKDRLPGLLREARAQADQLLGHGSNAIVTVATHINLHQTAHTCHLEAVRPGHWTDHGGSVQLVAPQVFQSSKTLRTIASTPRPRA